MIDIREIFEKDAMERYKVPLWIVQERREGESYNIDSGSILSHLHWEWQAWKRCHENLARASLMVSAIDEADKKIIGDMRDLADSICEMQADAPHQRGEEIIHLYDRADTIFGAEKIQVLLGILDNLIILHETPVEMPNKVYTAQVAGYISSYRSEVIEAIEKTGKKWTQK
ncbi:hypothetical protein [Klebsiella sp. HN106]|uniref:hypothetical protein n=1 Tax=Klebsiella sp. HN106 TaxID=3401058 RepID=UPI003EBDB98B